MGGRSSKDVAPPPPTEPRMRRKVVAEDSSPPFSNLGCHYKPVDVSHGPSLPLPLQSSNVYLDVNDIAAEVTIVQHYVNNLETTIEVSLLIPTGGPGSGVVICGLEADIGGKRLIGEAKGREEASNIFEDAIAGGGSAMLMEQRDEHTNVLTIGRLDPQERVTIKLMVASTGVAFPSAFKIQHVLPSALFSAFGEISIPSADDLNTAVGVVPHKGVSLTIGGRFSSTLSDIVCEGSAGGSAGGLTLDVSPLEDGKFLCAVSGPVVPGDVVLQFHVPGFATPTCSTELDDRAAGTDREGVACITIAPEQNPVVQSRIENEDINSEYIFVLDCSGSMRGNRINESVRAMKLFMKSISEGITFNIIRFGSNYKCLWPESRPFDDETLEEAMELLNATQADLGGTMLLPVLQYVFEKPVEEGRSRQMFVLTDGQVSNRDDCIKCAEKARGSTRVFTIGIGGADRVLVKELARAGNGRADILVEGLPQSALSAVVVSQLKEAQVVALTNCELRIPPFASKALTTIPPFFSSETRNLFVFFGAEQSSPFEVIFSAKCGEETIEETIVVDPKAASKGTLLHNLGVRQHIEELERGEKIPKEVEEELVRISQLFHQVCSFTSFVIVDESNRDPLKNAPLQQIVQEESESFRIPSPPRQLWAAGIRADSAGGGSRARRCDAPQAMLNMAMACAPPPPPASGYAMDKCAVGEMKSKKMRSVRSREKKAAESVPTSSRSLPMSGPVPEASPFDELLFSQKASGAFPDLQLVASVAGISREKLQEAAPTEPAISPLVWITILVIVVLEVRFSEQSQDWELIVKKAKRFLMKELNRDEQAVQTLCDKARAVLQDSS